MRDIALRMLNERPLYPVEIIKRWGDGYVAAWGLLTEEDEDVGALPKDFDGLRLIVRTEGRRPNAYADAVVSAEQIRDDESGMVLGGLLEYLGRACERVLAS
jgi:hypothetical protein